MNDETLRIVFTGGGTLGHLFPGLAVAAELKRLASHAQIVFAGSGKPAEHQQVLACGHHYFALPCSPSPRHLFDTLRFVTENARGWRQALHYLREHRPQAVVGLGGYASYPMARAAQSLGVPLVLLEQNAVPGRVTRRLAARAHRICLAFEESRKYLPAAGPIRMTGNPVRQIAAAGLSPQSVSRQLLVLGGSQGSESLNTAVPRALARQRSQLHAWTIVHQAGEFGVAAVTNLYAELGLKAQVAPFIEGLPEVMANSQLAISRAGGTTLAELACAGLPALLVPYPSASDDHQRRNAEVYARCGGCRIADASKGPSAVEEQLAVLLSRLLADESMRHSMSVAMRQQARPAAAWHAAQVILECIACAPRKRAA